MMSGVDISGVRARNNVVVTGRDEGPVVMLSHGFGCDQNMWRLIAPDLARDFRVVLFDHVGAGRSDLSAWRRSATRAWTVTPTTCWRSAGTWTCRGWCSSGTRSAP